MLSYRDRDAGPMRMAMIEPQPPTMSPSNSFMGSGMMLPDMPSMRPSHRWYGPETFGLDLQPMVPSHYPPRILPDDRYSPISTRRCQPPPPPPPPPPTEGLQPASTLTEASRYTKWRERRDTILNLDRETAQSSSRTDSLKSSLQQVDGRTSKGNDTKITIARTAKDKVTEVTVKKEPVKDVEKKPSTEKEKPVAENQDISDGEIVDDEDSDTDDSETMSTPAINTRSSERPTSLDKPILSPVDSGAYSRHNKESLFERDFYHENQPLVKKRRLHEREDYLLDYETISDDEDLEDIMAEKELEDDGSRYLVESGVGPSVVEDETSTGLGTKKSSEIELLNALGLDWANLVEIAKQSRVSSSSSLITPGSALARFSMPNYLPSLGISAELAGPKIHELITNICHV